MTPVNGRSGKRYALALYICAGTLTFFEQFDLNAIELFDFKYTSNVVETAIAVRPETAIFARSRLLPIYRHGDVELCVWPCSHQSALDVRYQHLRLYALPSTRRVVDCGARPRHFKEPDAAALSRRAQ